MVLAEETLTADAVAGDADALNALLRRHHNALHQRIAPRIGTRHQAVITAEDVLQITYVEAFLRIATFAPQGPGSFLAWLVRIAEHNLIDAIREMDRQKRPPPRRRVGVDPPKGDSHVALIDRVLGTTSTPSRVLSRQEMGKHLDAALGRLPPDYATVVRLGDLEGCSAEQISRVIGRSVGAVHMLRARARDRLAEHLRESQFFTDCA